MERKLEAYKKKASRRLRAGYSCRQCYVSEEACRVGGCNNKRVEGSGVRYIRTETFLQQRKKAGNS